MGRDEQFRDLFVDDYGRVVRTVFLILRDQGRAEEIAQEAFLELLRHWRRVSSHDRREAQLAEAGVEEWAKVHRPRHSAGCRSTVRQGPGAGEPRRAQR